MSEANKRSHSPPRHPDYDPAIALAWADARFKARLLKNPKAALASLNIVPPDGVTLQIVADSIATCRLVLPPPPPPGVSVGEQLSRVAGGVQRAAVLLTNFDHIVETAWRDPGFRAWLIRDAKAALASLDIVPPAGIAFFVVEDAADTCTLVIPPPPVDEEEMVEQVGDVVNRIARWTAMIASPFAS
ncbi:MAG: nitrile hydratase subunit alpha [Rhodospirillaceae bacterium]